MNTPSTRRLAGLQSHLAPTTAEPSAGVLKWLSSLFGGGEEEQADHGHGHGDDDHGHGHGDDDHGHGHGDDDHDHGHGDDHLILHAEMVLDCRCGVGEGLFWDADDQLLRFLDIPGKKLWSYDPVTEATTTHDTPQRPGSAHPLTPPPTTHRG